MEASLEHLTFEPHKTPKSMDRSSIYTYDSYSGHPSPRLGSMLIAADYPSHASGGSYVATPAHPYTPSLLRLSIEHSAPRNADAPPPVRKDIDTDVIDYILGKPDAVLMKEALEVALDKKQDEEARVQALDDFEMLVEQIDNTNDLAKLKMWDPLQSLLTSQNSSNDIKVQTLWIIGTAVQNNPSAQNVTVQSAQLRSKAVHALSSLCKHNSRTVKQPGESEGWEAVSIALEDSDITARPSLTLTPASYLQTACNPEGAAMEPFARPLLPSRATSNTTPLLSSHLA